MIFTGSDAYCRNLLPHSWAGPSYTARDDGDYAIPQYVNTWVGWTQFGTFLLIHHGSAYGDLEAFTASLELRFYRVDQIHPDFTWRIDQSDEDAPDGYWEEENPNHDVTQEPFNADDPYHRWTLLELHMERLITYLLKDWREGQRICEENCNG